MSEPSDITICKYASYLQMINLSVGTKMFKNLIASVNNVKVDILNDGDLSCAYFVTSVLVIFRLIKSPHATVRGAIKDIEMSGWKMVSKPQKGSILVWEDMIDNSGNNNSHIGFYIGRNLAISNSSAHKTPVEHHWTFENTRKVVAIYSGVHLF